MACPPHFRGLKPYEHDCHRFINCADGRPVIQTCGPGTAFNAVVQTCDHQTQVSCEGQSGRSARLQERPLQPRCDPGFSGLQPHPTDCTKFLNCANGQTFIQNCGPGTAFSPSKLVCDYKNKVNCAEAPGQGKLDFYIRTCVSQLTQAQVKWKTPRLVFDVHQVSVAQFPFPTIPRNILYVKLVCVHDWSNAYRVGYSMLTA